jgi:hypothetical protein
MFKGIVQSIFKWQQREPQQQEPRLRGNVDIFKECFFGEQRGKKMSPQEVTAFQAGLESNYKRDSSLVREYNLRAFGTHNEYEVEISVGQSTPIQEAWQKFCRDFRLNSLKQIVSLEEVPSWFKNGLTVCGKGLSRSLNDDALLDQLVAARLIELLEEVDTYEALKKSAKQLRVEITSTEAMWGVIRKYGMRPLSDE